MAAQCWTWARTDNDLWDTPMHTLRAGQIARDCDGTEVKAQSSTYIILDESASLSWAWPSTSTKSEERIPHLKMSADPAPCPHSPPARSRTGPAQILQRKFIKLSSPSTRLCLQLTLTGMVQDWLVLLTLFHNSMGSGRINQAEEFTKSDLAYITNISMRHKNLQKQRVPSPTAFED